QDSSQDADEDNARDKFRTERSATISLTANTRSMDRQIPDSLDSLAADFKRNQKHENKQKKRRNRQNRRQFGSHYERQTQPMSAGMSSGGSHHNRGPDLRNLINRPPNGRRHGFNQTNRLLSESNALIMNQIQNLANNLTANLNPITKLQMDLGILNPNQLLLNALLSQNQSIPAANRLPSSLTTGRSTSSLNQMQALKPNDDIQITIRNRNNNNSGQSLNAIKMSTKPQIKCLVTKDKSDSDIEILSETDGSHNSGSNLFSGLSVNDNERANSSGNGDHFANALAEAEVGVDNDYLTRLREQEEQRRQLKEYKEKRRLEMADERLQSAEHLKAKIANRNTFRR
ncbi:unnamed protein product, partial [Medioppia subpectinata]